MKNRALYCCIAVSLLAGCSSLGMSPMAREGDSATNPCKNAKCDVDIVVTSCTDIKADPPAMYIGKGNNAKIHWYLKGAAGYTFTANGIDWKTPEGKREFDQSKPGATEFVWKDKSVNPGSYPYSVHLKGPGGTTCDVDPTVVNG